MFKKIKFHRLGTKAKEAYNYAKTAAILAEYGYECCWLTNDTNGADFLANHDKQTLRVQLKSCVSFDPKYWNKDILIAFLDEGGLWLYYHDKLLPEMPQSTQDAIYKNGAYSYNPLGETMRQRLKDSKHAFYLD